MNKLTRKEQELAIKYNIRDWNLYNDYVEVYFNNNDDNLKIDKKEFEDRKINFIDTDTLAYIIAELE